MPYNPELYIHITRRTFKKPLNILQQEMQTCTGYYYVHIYCIYIATLHSASTKNKIPPTGNYKLSVCKVNYVQATYPLVSYHKRNEMMKVQCIQIVFLRWRSTLHRREWKCCTLVIFIGPQFECSTKMLLTQNKRFTDGEHLSFSVLWLAQHFRMENILLTNE